MTDTVVKGQIYAHHSCCHGVAAHERSQACATWTDHMDGIKGKFMLAVSSNTVLMSCLFSSIFSNMLLPAHSTLPSQSCS